MSILRIPFSGPPKNDSGKNVLILFFFGSSCAINQIGPDIARLHLNGGVVGEIKVDFLNGNEGVGGDLSTVLLSGGDSSTDGSVQGYAHYVRVLPQPTVTNHYVKVSHIILNFIFSKLLSNEEFVSFSLCLFGP